MRSAHVLSRRKFISMTSVAAVAVPLAGCGILPVIPVASWVAGIQAIGTEIATLLPGLAGIAGIPASTVAQITQIITEIEQIAAGIGIASSASAGQTALQAIEALINTLAPLLLPILSLIPGGAIIGIIVAALPAIEAALGMVISLLTPPAMALSARAPSLTSSRLRGSAVTSRAVSQQYLMLLIAMAARR